MLKRIKKWIQHKMIEWKKNQKALEKAFRNQEFNPK